MENFFQKIGALFRTDIRYLYREGSAIGIGYFVSVFSGVILAFTIANILDPSEYGIYKYLLSLAGVVGALTLTGFSASLTRSIAKGFDGTFFSAVRSQLRWSLIAVVVGLAIAIYYLINDALFFGLVILAVSLLIPFRDLGLLSDGYLNGRELFKFKTIVNAKRVITTTFFVLAVAYFSREVYLIVFSQFLFETIGLLIIFFYALKKFPLRNKSADDVSYGKHLSVLDIIQRLFAQADKVLVFQLFGAVAVASYSIALMPVLQLFSMTKVIRTLIAPRLSKRTFTEIHATILHKVIALLLVSGVIAIVYYFFTPILYTYLLPKYTHIVPLAQIATIILLFSPQALFGQILVAQKCKRELYYSTMFQNIFFVVFIGVGAYLGGMSGALVGFVVSRGINLLIAILAYYSAYKRYLSSQNANITAN